MLIRKGDIALHNFLCDKVSRLLFTNALFVILGYGAAYATGGASVNAVRIFKSVFLVISLLYVLSQKFVKQPSQYFESGKGPVIFCFLALLFTLISPDFFDALNRAQTFALPFFYIYLSLAYLLKKFGIKTILKGLHLAIIFIYSIPLISYIIFGGNLSDTNIYGQDDSNQVFVSNHYGWSSALYILSFIFVFRNIKVRKYFMILMGSVLVIAVILLFSSANRASLLSIALSIIPLMLKYKGVKRWHKVAFVIIFIGVLFYLLGKPDSAINFLIDKSKSQEAEGETRFKITALMFSYFNSHPLNWITGIGIFNYSLIHGKTNVLTYHNSYWEILFGLGLPLFFAFLSFMVFRPVYRFIKIYSKYTLLLIPLIIIPYFESNLTAGQFLFFPWFTYMLLLNAKLKFWDKKKNKPAATLKYNYKNIGLGNGGSIVVEQV